MKPTPVPPNKLQAYISIKKKLSVEHRAKKQKEFYNKIILERMYLLRFGV